MAPKKLKAKKCAGGDVFLGMIGEMPCYTVTLRGGLTDADSNWRLWNADMKVYRDGEGAGRDSWTTNTSPYSSPSPNPSPSTSSSPHPPPSTSSSPHPPPSTSSSPHPPPSSSADPTTSTSTTTLTSTEEWPSIDDEILTKMERRRKAIIWFSVSEALREKYLTDMGGRDKTSEDVMRRLFENVAPPGTKYQALETLKVEEHMRESVRRARERCSRLEREKREKGEEEGDE